MTDISITGTHGVTRAYRASQTMPTQPVMVPSLVEGGQKSNTPSFSDMVEKAAVDAVSTVRAGDQAVIMGMRGELSTQAVIEATMEMETTLKTVVAVRDKVVDAYQEILRMAV